MRLEGFPVAVAGAGIGGAVAALLLARAGARVTVYERVAALGAVGAGIALQPNGLAVLYGLGLEPALALHGRKLQAPRIADAAGNVLLAPALPADPSGLDHILMIRRSHLQELLVGALGREPNVTLRLGVEVESASSEGEVVLRGPGGAEHAAFGLVVGADGVHSRVRAAGDFGARVEPSGISYVRGLSRVDSARNEEAWTSAGIFGSFPLPDGTYFYCSAGHPAVRAALESRDLVAFRKAWEGAYPPGAALLATVDRFETLVVNEVIRVDCARFFSGRRVLLGDAAHAMAPNLGQGANSALVDAAALLDELSRVESLEVGLAAYDARRRPAVRWVQDAAGASGRLSERTGRGFRWMRDRVLMRLAALGAGDRVKRSLQETPSTLRAIAERRV